MNINFTSPSKTSMALCCLLLAPFVTPVEGSNPLGDEGLGRGARQRQRVDTLKEEASKAFELAKTAAGAKRKRDSDEGSKAPKRPKKDTAKAKASGNGIALLLRAGSEPDGKATIALTKKQKKRQCLYQQGEAFYINNKRTKVVSVFTKLLGEKGKAGRPILRGYKRTRAHLLRGHAIYFGTDEHRFESAVLDLRVVVNAQGVNAHNRAAAFCILGDCYVEGGEYQQAAAFYEKALSLKDKNQEPILKGFMRGAIIKKRDWFDTIGISLDVCP